MSLIDQIFEQAKLGTAVSPDANPFATGVQLGQHQQQLNMELATLPLRQTLLQQDAQMNAGKIDLFLQQRNEEAQATQAFAGLAGQVAPLVRAGKIDEAQNQIIAAASENGFLAADPRTKALFDFTTKALDSQLALIAAKKDTFDTPRAVTVPSAIPGNPPYEAVQTGPKSFTLPQSTVTEFKLPDGTIYQQRTGAGGAAAGSGGAVEKAVATEAEKKLAANTTGLAMLNESLAQISPTTVGPVGAVREAVEKGANIISPGSMSTEATKARSTFRSTAQNLFNSLKADSQINKWEGARISEIADITKLNESDPTAREKYNTLRDLTAYKSLLLSHELNRFAPDDVLRNLSLDQANRAFLRGHLTPAEAKRWGELTGH